MKDRLDAIRAEMVSLEMTRLSDSAAADRFKELSAEGAAIVNETAKAIAKKFGRRAPTMTADKFAKTYQIGRTA